ncbi:MAG: DUF2304 family protein [Magnetococcales bacterium]|nr:DUF2304 family protein [Magnetococcales bacterium]
MTPRQTMLIVLLGLIFLGSVLIFIQRHMFREKYAILWLVIGVLFVSTPYLYDFFVSIGHYFDIINPTSFFFFFAIIEIILLCIQFTIAISVAFNQRKVTIQNLAILEHRVCELEKCIMKNKPHE